MKPKALSIFLICVILALSVLDAPEYVKCTDIGICEFLELQCHLGNDIISEVIGHIFDVKRNNLFSMMENIINRKELIQNLIFFSIPAILKSIRSGYKPAKGQNIDSTDTENSTYLIENILIEENLKIVEISIIRS